MELESTFEDLWTEKSFDLYESTEKLKLLEMVRAKINPDNPESVTSEQLAQRLMKGMN